MRRWCWAKSFGYSVFASRFAFVFVDHSRIDLKPFIMLMSCWSIFFNAHVFCQYSQMNPIIRNIVVISVGAAKHDNLLLLAWGFSPSFFSYGNYFLHVMLMPVNWTNNLLIKIFFGSRKFMRFNLHKNIFFYSLVYLRDVWKLRHRKCFYCYKQLRQFSKKRIKQLLHFLRIRNSLIIFS